MSYRQMTITCLICLVLATGFSATPASAQMTKEGWKFTQQNRAAIASLMQQNSRRNNGTMVASGGTTLVCGGGSSDATSSAMGNSSCIILNNSTGMLDIEQDSLGDQSSNANAEFTSNGSGSTSDILETLIEIE
ncbi:MAG: hypothetical protein EA357_11575 [Micavibrio sp.]|nr:MAG: hypothetical protein EA357_11575 [Micavibrio sp.]